jgi:aminoglycoside phosphotransferase
LIRFLGKPWGIDLGCFGVSDRHARMALPAERLD